MPYFIRFSMIRRALAQIRTRHIRFRIPAHRRRLDQPGLAPAIDTNQGACASGERSWQALPDCALQGQCRQAAICLLSCMPAAGCPAPCQAPVPAAGIVQPQVLAVPRCPAQALCRQALLTAAPPAQLKMATRVPCAPQTPTSHQQCILPGSGSAPLCCTSAMRWVLSTEALTSRCMGEFPSRGPRPPAGAARLLRGCCGGCMAPPSLTPESEV